MATIHSPEFGPKKEMPACDDAGFFTWDITTNQLHADGAIAEMFGLDPKQAESGLPLEIYLARIHPDDRPAVAMTIRDTIVTTESEHQSYRTKRADGTFVTVLVFARCFRDQAGIPSRYAGIIFPAVDEVQTPTPLLRCCLAAYEIALKEGKTLVAARLRDVLVDQGWQDPGPIVTDGTLFR